MAQTYPNATIVSLALSEILWFMQNRIQIISAWSICSLVYTSRIFTFGFGLLDELGCWSVSPERLCARFLWRNCEVISCPLEFSSFYPCVSVLWHRIKVSAFWTPELLQMIYCKLCTSLNWNPCHVGSSLWIWHLLATNTKMLTF